MRTFVVKKGEIHAVKACGRKREVFLKERIAAVVEPLLVPNVCEYHPKHSIHAFVAQVESMVGHRLSDDLRRFVGSIEGSRSGGTWAEALGVGPRVGFRCVVAGLPCGQALTVGSTVTDWMAQTRCSLGRVGWPVLFQSVAWLRHSTGPGFVPVVRLQP